MMMLRPQGWLQPEDGADAPKEEVGASFGAFFEPSLKEFIKLI